MIAVKGEVSVEILRVKSFADRLLIVAEVKDGGDTRTIGFSGPTTGSGVVVMISGDIEVFVSDPSRFGEFGREWVINFFTD